jgi:hypothetical protein
LLVPDFLPVRLDLGEVVVGAVRGHLREPATVTNSPAQTMQAVQGRRHSGR